MNWWHARAIHWNVIIQRVCKILRLYFELGLISLWGCVQKILTFDVQKNLIKKFSSFVNIVFILASVIYVLDYSTPEFYFLLSPSIMNSIRHISVIDTIFILYREQLFFLEWLFLYFKGLVPHSLQISLQICHQKERR